MRQVRIKLILLLPNSEIKKKYIEANELVSTSLKNLFVCSDWYI